MKRSVYTPGAGPSPPVLAGRDAAVGSVVGTDREAGGVRVAAGRLDRQSGRMATLQDVLERHVAAGALPGVVGAIGYAEGGLAQGDGGLGQPDRGDWSVEELEIGVAGDLAKDAIVRIQSMTKAVVSVATLRLVERGRLDLNDPVHRWLPELADRRVLRTPNADLDDTVPATAPITVEHLLTNMCGYGMALSPSPLQDAMRANRTEAGPEPVALGSDAWVAALADLPLAFEPGTGWRYHHGFALLGVLLSRAVGRPLGEHLRADLFDPLGMLDTGHALPQAQAHRLPAAYRQREGAGLEQIEPAGSGFYVEPVPFDVSHAELVSTLTDYCVFARMLASGGRHDDRQVIDPRLLHEMTRNQVPASAKTPESFFPGFWEGMGWGYGVAIETAGAHRGRYGWSGGLGTDFFIDPSGGFGVVLAQVEMGPAIFSLLEDVQRLVR